MAFDFKQYQTDTLKEIEAKDKAIGIHRETHTIYYKGGTHTEVKIRLNRDLYNLLIKALQEQSL